MRLFIALDLPEAEKEVLFRATAALRGAGLPVRWVEQESLHLTLKFLGWVRPDAVERIASAMAEAAAKTRPFDLPIGGLGAFPTRRRPRVIWLGVEATPSLRCLKHDLEWTLAPLGYERETRAFQPHITLGRAKHDAGAGEFRDVDALFAATEYEALIPITDVHLFRSHLSADGARYERIASSPLGVSAPGAPVRERARG